MKFSDDELKQFAYESNMIERILDEQSASEHYHALKILLSVDEMSINALKNFVRVIQPDAKLRELPSDRVWIGGHEAPSGPVAYTAITKLIELVNNNQEDAWTTHKLYESIHPFLDGNGRSGRALFLWQISYNDERYYPSLSFLHNVYYRELSQQRDDPGNRLKALKKSLGV